jgi:hypothetical protein
MAELPDRRPIAPEATAGQYTLPAGELACLTQAARDCRYLLARGYPRTASLTLVGNRYQLSAAVREILRRGVFPPAVARQHRRKLVPLAALRGRPLALDGHNVVLTLECARRGIPVVAADDGFIRDIGRLSRNHRPTATTLAVVAELARCLSQHAVAAVQVWYDAPMSGSGDLAARTQEIFLAAGLEATARAVPVPEVKLAASGGAVASSDTQLIAACRQLVDIAGEIIRSDPALPVIVLRPQRQKTLTV